MFCTCVDVSYSTVVEVIILRPRVCAVCELLQASWVYLAPVDVLNVRPSFLLYYLYLSSGTLRAYDLRLTIFSMNKTCCISCCTLCSGVSKLLVCETSGQVAQQSA